MRKPAKPKMGRPPKIPSERKDSITPIRFRDEEKEAYQEAAKRSDLSLSEWIRQTLNHAIDTNGTRS